MPQLHSAACGILAVLFLLKQFEITYHLIRTYEIRQVVDGMEPKDMVREWPISYKIAAVTSWLPHWTRRLLFRFYILATLHIGLIVWQPSAKLSILSGGVLLLGVWIQLARIVVDQIKYGSGAYLRGSGLSGPLFQRAQYGESSTQRLRAFIRLFLGLCMIVATSYAALYTLCFGQLGSNTFTGIPADGYEILHFLYFSLVTLATVGYGDIIPAQQLIPRLLVGSEIAAGFLILVVLVTSVGLTFQDDTPKEKAEK